MIQFVGLECEKGTILARCASCGEPVPIGLAACPSCGAALDSEATVEEQNFQQPDIVARQNAARIASIVWGLVGFMIPIVGLVLYLVWRNSQPQRAKYVLSGAVVGVVFGLFANLAIPQLFGTAG
ncbi:MAG: hypothetical protein IJ113_02850 [Eggerthellaceae bacterium]|nr:hypothetical protein [Eggerthellaceae bacterium]